MARKQSDYLADILAEESPDSNAVEGGLPATSPTLPHHSAPDAGEGAHRAGMSLLGRESALARVASGEVKQITQLLVDPAQVRIWSGNARIQTRLSEDNCRDLIDSIISEGGQKVPVVVRRITNNDAFNYEVIAGSRRHFSISWLRANNYPDMKLLAQVADMDDEAAFRFADIENRARKDVSDIERARNYAAAINDYYAGRQRRMSERLYLSEGWLSKMLAVARLPDDVINAFASPSDIQLKPAYPLAKWCSEKGNLEAAINRARKLQAEQQSRSANAQTLLSATDVIRQIMHGIDSEIAPSPALPLVRGSSGRPILSVASRNRQGITLRLHAGGGASHGELAEALKTVLKSLQEEGKGLQS